MQGEILEKEGGNLIFFLMHDILLTSHPHQSLIRVQAF